MADVDSGFPADTTLLPGLGKRRRLAGAVDVAVGEAITGGALAPGTRLREADLAATTTFPQPRCARRRAGWSARGWSRSARIGAPTSPP